jgi:DNA-cytosine methyltransferase
MKHGSLFSGIGGFDLASEWMGWENVFHCEWMEFPRKVLDYYWPNADSHIDICKTDFKKYANKIDILTGGWPCQPFSHAGKRKGTKDERFLWHEMLRAIQEIKPKFVIGENVLGITNIDGGMVFEKVCVDLETEGYEVQPFIIPACAKNAPHRRDRCWFIAFKNTLHGGCLHGEHEQERAEVRKFGNVSTRSADGIYLSEGDVTDTEQLRLEHGSKTRNVLGSISEAQRKKRKSSDESKTDDHVYPEQGRYHPKLGTASQLNPRFVAEMMGFPPNWTELPFLNGGQNQLKDTETP